MAEVDVISQTPDDTNGKQLLKSYLNKNMKIKLTDGRILIGIFLCTDKDANVILGSCAEHLKDETVDEPRYVIFAKKIYLKKAHEKRYQFHGIIINCLFSFHLEC